MFEESLFVYATVMSRAAKDRALPPGSKVRLTPGHCDPTVNLYDWYVCYRNDGVQALWPISARGAVL